MLELSAQVLPTSIQACTHDLSINMVTTKGAGQSIAELHTLEVVQVNSEVLYLSWSWSGSALALGQEDGRISMRDSAGAEFYAIRSEGRHCRG